MSRIFKIVGIILVVVGAAIAAFTDVGLADFIGIGVAATGLAVTCVATYKKSKSKDWKLVLSIVLIVIGSFGMILGGLADNLVTEIIASVFGLVSLIVGMVVAKVTSK